MKKNSPYLMFLKAIEFSLHQDMDPLKFSDEIFQCVHFSKDQCLELFQYQSQAVQIYRSFIDALGIQPSKVRDMHQIPFLPIEFFKSHNVLSESSTPQLWFTSSGTSGSEVSRHGVSHPEMYTRSFRQAFQNALKPAKGTAILGLLPSYLEREGSSLVYMVDQLIRDSGEEDSGFFLHNQDELFQLLQQREHAQKPSILIGVTYALLDFAERFPTPLRHTTIMETGGMKGRRKELIREEVHGLLKEAFQVHQIASEYGMTELLSQAYALSDGLFTCPPWMKVLVRDSTDPLQVSPSGKGALNIIDLANISSCAFLATSDIGIVYPNGTFEVQGRLDHADIRGCNLLVA